MRRRGETTHGARASMRHGDEPPRGQSMTAYVDPLLQRCRSALSAAPDDPSWKLQVQACLEGIDHAAKEFPGTILRTCAAILGAALEMDGPARRDEARNALELCVRALQSGRI